MAQFQNNQNLLKIIAQGGYQEYGRNSTLIIYRGEGLILDCGINIGAIVNNERDKIYPLFNKQLKKVKLRGVLLSHAHLDHIGAITEFNKQYPGLTYYGSVFTNEVCKNLSYNIDSVNLNPGEQYEIGVFRVQVIEIQHSIPGAFFYKIYANDVTICYASDFKIDYRPILGRPTHLDKLKLELGHIDYFIFDTTRAYADRTYSETYVQNLLTEQLIYGKDIYANLLHPCFSSHVGRIKSVIQVAQRIGYNVYIIGKSFPVYLKAADSAKIYSLPSHVRVISKNYNKFFDAISKTRNNLLIMSGVNAEPNAVLSRIVNEDLKLQNMDKNYVIFGGHEIPRMS